MLFAVHTVQYADSLYVIVLSYTETPVVQSGRQLAV